MEGWTGPKFLEDIEKEYVEWLNMSSEQQRQYKTPDNFPYGKIWVIKKVRSHLDRGLRESKELVEIWEKFRNEKIMSSANWSYSPTQYEVSLLSNFGYARIVKEIFKEKPKEIRKRLLRPEGDRAEGCIQDHAKVIEWRVVDEYEIHIANFCPSCGTKISTKK